MEYTFKIIIEECEEGGYYAECPAFQGCHVEGTTYKETINEMKHVIAGFIEDCNKCGEKIPSDDFTIASVSVAV